MTFLEKGRNTKKKNKLKTHFVQYNRVPYQFVVGRRITTDVRCNEKEDFGNEVFSNRRVPSRT